MKSVLNERNFKYHFWGGRFHMLPQSYTFSHDLCLNNFLQVLLIGIQMDQVPLFIYINQYNEVFHFYRVSKLIGDMKYLMRPVK